MRDISVVSPAQPSAIAGAGRRFNPQLVGPPPWGQRTLWAALAHRLSNSLAVPVFTDFFYSYRTVRGGPTGYCWQLGHLVAFAVDIDG